MKAAAPYLVNEALINDSLQVSVFSSCHPISEQDDFEGCSSLLSERSTDRRLFEGLCYFVVIEMKKLKSNDDTLDRLSELPDSLVHEILSLMEMRDVVKTTLLSKRWKYRWITIPCLQFKEKGNFVQIRNFVSRALTLWRGIHLRKFSVCFYGGCKLQASLCSDINLWLLFAKQRKVEELSMQLLLSDPLYCPPQCLYECSSITKLFLEGCNLEIRGNVQWDCLNSLELFGCLLSEDVINQVLSSSPQLETFTLTCPKGLRNLSIRSSSLKKLSIFSGYYEYESSNIMTIWAPNLKALKISGYPYTKCLLTDVSSLAEVHLCFLCLCSTRVGEAFCQILPAIQHVVTVLLSDYCFQMLRVMKQKYSLPPLLNVKLLRIGRGLTELRELVDLLEVFPKLKMLIIDWKSVGELFKFNYIMSEANILKSNLLQLRTAENTWYSYKASIFQFIEFLLKHATVIEKIVV